MTTWLRAKNLRTMQGDAEPQSKETIEAEGGDVTKHDAAIEFQRII